MICGCVPNKQKYIEIPTSTRRFTRPKLEDAGVFVLKLETSDDRGTRWQVQSPCYLLDFEGWCSCISRKRGNTKPFLIFAAMSWASLAHEFPSGPAEIMAHIEGSPSRSLEWKRHAPQSPSFWSYFTTFTWDLRSQSLAQLLKLLRITGKYVQSKIWLCGIKTRSTSCLSLVRVPWMTEYPMAGVRAVTFVQARLH